MQSHYRCHMDESQHALHIFLAQVTEEIASEYQRIFSSTAEDPGTAGDEGEENWATLLRDWLPPAYHVATKGRLIGADGTKSPQIDVLVLKPFYPAKLREKKVWLANGVAAAFECKTTIRASHINASLERCRNFKKLFPKRTGSPLREFRSPLIYGILSHSHCWKAPDSRPIDNITRALADCYEASSHPSETIDLVCVADVGSWTNMAMPYWPIDIDKKGDVLAQLQNFTNWAPVSGMLEASYENNNYFKQFQPIGAMISYLTQRLAWNDESIRDLADYYRLAKMWGSGESKIMKTWPRNVLSPEVLDGIASGRIHNNGSWSEWRMISM